MPRRSSRHLFLGLALAFAPALSAQDATLVRASAGATRPRQPAGDLTITPLDNDKQWRSALDKGQGAYGESEISPMPRSLLDRLTREEILDLLAFIDVGGDPARRNAAW